MKSIAITPLCTKFNFLGLVGCFLVEQPDGLALIDTNMNAPAADMITEIRRRNAPLKNIVLTHAHVDHVGGLDAIAAAYPDATVWISEREAEIYKLAQQGVPKEKFPLHPDEPQTPVKGGFQKNRTNIGRTFIDGDCIGALRVVATPGHTPGHCSLLDERDGTLFAGDAVIRFESFRSCGDWPWYFPLPKFVTWHPATALESVRKLAALKPARVCQAHGAPVLEDVESSFARAIASAEKKLRSTTA